MAASWRFCCSTSSAGAPQASRAQHAIRLSRSDGGIAESDFLQVPLSEMCHRRTDDRIVRDTLDRSHDCQHQMPAAELALRTKTRELDWFSQDSPPDHCRTSELPVHPTKMSPIERLGIGRPVPRR